MLCLGSNSWCVWVQIYAASAFKCMLCLNSNSCCLSSNTCYVCFKIHVVFEYNTMLCLSSWSCCMIMQIYLEFEFKNLSHIWIKILDVFEFNFILCLNTIVYCIIQWISVIVHLVRMAERVPYQHVVTGVPVAVDSLGISVKVHLIFILLCVLSVNINKSKRSWRNY